MGYPAYMPRRRQEAIDKLDQQFEHGGYEEIPHALKRLADDRGTHFDKKRIRDLVKDLKGVAHAGSGVESDRETSEKENREDTIRTTAIVDNRSARVTAYPLPAHAPGDIQRYEYPRQFLTEQATAQIGNPGQNPERFHMGLLPVKRVRVRRII